MGGATFFIILLILLGAYVVILWRLYEQRKRTKLILQISLKLNSVIHRKQLLEIIMESTASALRAEGSSIILVDQESGELYFEIATGDKHEEVKQIRLQPGEGIAGWVASTGESVLIADASKDPRWSNRVSTKVQVPTRNMICVPVRSKGKMLGVLQVINKQGKRPFHKRDLRLLEMIAALAAIALDNMLLYEALLASIEDLRITTAAKERMESEIRIARQIQRNSLPHGQFSLDRIQLNASLIPAREVGGDFYYYSLLDKRRLLICLGDVADKGMPAALFLSGLMSWIKAAATSVATPSQLMENINRQVSSEDSTMFATMFTAMIDLQTGLMTYCNGGHCLPYIISRDRIEMLEANKTLPIGVFPDTVYMDEKIQMNEGDLFLLYTDGVTEAENGDGEWFGKERLHDVLHRLMNSSPVNEIMPESLNHTLIESIQHFCSGHTQTDDIALLSFAYKKN